MELIKKVCDLSNLKGAIDHNTNIQNSVMQELPETDDEFDYGETKRLSDDNDVNPYPIGGVFFLPDAFGNTNEKTYHPYILLNDEYNTKAQIVPMLKLTSSSSIIDLIPIVVNGEITYIYPYKIYYINVSVVKDQSKFMGDISKSQAFNLALNVCAIKNGLPCLKTKEEVEQDFYEYVDAFKEKHKTKEVHNYKNKIRKYKYVTSRDLKNLEEVKSEHGQTIVDKVVNAENVVQFNNGMSIISDTPNDANDVPVKKSEQTKVTPIVKKSSVKEVKSTKTVANKKPTMDVYWQSQAILSAIASTESLPRDKVKLPTLNNMSDDEIKIFLAYKEINTIDKTAKFYGCSVATVSNRYKQICDKYKVNYRL